MELLTIDETARMLKVNPITVRRFIADGRLPAVRVGKGVRVHKEAVEKLPAPVKPRATRRAPSVPSGRPTSADDPLWKIVRIGDSGPNSPTDVAQNKHKYLADAYTATNE